MAAAAWDVAQLSVDDRRQVQEWLRAFAAHWRPDALAQRVHALPAAGSPLRLPALLGLVECDLRHRWQAGQRVTVETYLRQYTELGTAATVPVRLIHAEYEARVQAGSLHDLPHFARRFPTRTAELQALVQTGVGQDSVADDPGAPAPAPGPATLAMQLGRYRIVKLLGQGGMGTVYLAYDTELERSVALKVPHVTPEDGPDVHKRFYREAKAAATLSHPNLCQVYDVGSHDGVPFLAMAFIEGETLAARLRREGPLAPAEAAGIVRTIALALHEAHALGVIHRDLKPANVMLNRRGEPVVMDFGLARQTNSQSARLTRLGSIMGTPSYMPPEQVRGEVAAMGPGCDIYSLGVILYELLTGEVPFDGPVAAVLGQILTQPPAPPSALRPDLDPRLNAVCLRALQKDIVLRYADMQELAAVLDDFLAAPGVSVMSAPTIRPPVQNIATQAPQSPRATRKAGSAAATASRDPFAGLTDGPVEPPPRREDGKLWAAVVVGGLMLVILGTGAASLLIAISWLRRAPAPAPAALAKPPVRQAPVENLVVFPPKNPIVTGAPPGDAAPVVLPKGPPDPVAPAKVVSTQAKLDLDLGGGVPLTMVRIEPGTFRMGSPPAERERGPDEFQHTVEITRPFYMGVHTVTQAQYRQVMGTNPSWFSAQGGRSNAVAGMNTDDFPVEKVSWDDAMAFCAKVSERPAVKARGRMDLPTEAQWEYACRAETTTAFHYGNSLSSAQANFNGQFPYGGAAKGTYLERTAKVGSYLPNAWGLFDMHGNVLQWCKDGYDKEYYVYCPRADPCNETKAEFRVLRGGSWSIDARYCRSAFRDRRAPGRHGLVGFRVVLCLD